LPFRRVGRSLAIERDEHAGGFSDIAGLEKGEAEVHAQAGDRRISGCSFAVVADGLTVVLLPGLKKTDVRTGFGVPGVSAEKRMPRGVGRRDVSLLFEGESGIAPGRAGSWLSPADRPDQKKHRCGE